MINRTSMKIACALLVMLSLCSTARPQSGCYPDRPPVLAASVKKTAESIVQMDEEQLSTSFNEMLVYTVADASTGSIQTEVRKLKKYRALGETARTDKQLGATARSQGSTSAIQKPGLVRLLGFAIENGAIQQEITGTTLTLLTSPYAVVAAIEGDTDETYRKYELFNRLNLSATFNLTNQDNPLANVNTKQLTEWSARVRLTGDRSTRSERFQEFWNTEIQQKVQFRLDVNAGLRDTIVNDPAITGFADPSNPDSLVSQLKAQIKSYLASHATDTDQNKIDGVEQIILCGLKSSVYDPIQNGTIRLQSNTLAELNTGLVNLQQAHLQLAEARRRLAEFLEQFLNEGTLSTFEYTNYRQNGLSDYSTLRILFERNVSPVKLVANAGLSIYNDPNPALNQERLRDFVAALSFEADSRSPFVDPEQDLSKITYSFTGSYQRLRENENMQGRQPDIVVAQFKVNVPIAYGLRIPISFTYSNATEMSNKSEFRANFGLTLDMDKLISITRGQ